MIKGEHCSEETKQKISESRLKRKQLLGYLNSPETRYKISKTQIGRIVSEETRRKLSKAHIGKECSQETKDKISIANIGKKRSQETKDKLSESHKGKRHPHSEETKIKIGEANKGKIRSQELRDKISETNKRRVLSKEARQRMSEAHKGKKQSSELILKRIKKGEEHYNWQGGISFEPYTIQFNRELKELVRKRDNYKCQICGMPEIENIHKLDIHHIDYNKKNCLPSNLISLCRKCHMKTNFNREYWMEYFNSKK